MKVYSEKKAEDYLKKSVPIAKNIFTKEKKDAEKFAKKMKYNVVLKIISDKALHKTEVGGIFIAKNKESFDKGFNMLENKGKKLKYDGILVQEFVKGVETIIGVKKDSSFGHVILFGIGGITVELLKDVSFRICPVDEKEALEMIKEIKMSKLLEGFRGSKKANIKKLSKTISSISKLVADSNIEEMDINPLIVNDKEAKVADARIVFNS